MYKRIERKIEDTLSEDQFGFRKNMGTREPILVLFGTVLHLSRIFSTLLLYTRVVVRTREDSRRDVASPRQLTQSYRVL